MAKLSSPVLTPDEVCAELKIHLSTLYRLIKFHHFPHFKIGSDFRFNREHIREWAELQERLIRLDREGRS